MKRSDIGIYGLGVMGRNFALNLHDHGFTVSVFNRRLPGEEREVEKFLSGEASGTDIRGFKKIGEFAASLSKPRRILIMVKSGPPVDSVIDHLSPCLDRGDILIDGGNSHYGDTGRRMKALASAGIRFAGMGVSGGEEGARSGPSLMPGGDAGLWPELQPVLQSVAATAPDGTPCCSWMGAEGAGHFVKMVHNGIEYAIMQLLAECYHVMKSALGMPHGEIGDTFDRWNSGLLSSYLLEITADIFFVTDEDRNLILEKILDRAGQKGTGRWAAITSLELGVPLPLITGSVYARTLSSFKDLRERAAGQHKTVSGNGRRDSADITNRLQEALLGSQLVAFAEGFWLIRAANSEFGWGISPADVADVWRGGCIIRSSLLEPVARSYRENPALSHLMLAPAFKEPTDALQKGWRMSAAFALETGIPVPAITAALSHFDALISGRLPANLIQAQRDFFGAHRYERTDYPRDTFFHTEWRKKSGK